MTTSPDGLTWLMARPPWDSHQSNKVQRSESCFGLGLVINDLRRERYSHPFLFP
jgi:hypothetical protein